MRTSLIAAVVVGVAVWVAASAAGGEKQPDVEAAALKLVPGTVNAVERDSEKGATWEVEVRKPDGSVVDVRLDADLQKVAIDSDSEAEDDSGAEDR
jgi:peptidase YpeB-like protein